MIYTAVQLIQIFLAGPATGPRVDHGGTRGPRGPKKFFFIKFLLETQKLQIKGQIEDKYVYNHTLTLTLSINQYIFLKFPH